MKTNFITKVRTRVSIATGKKTANILDGTYKSVFKGRSMDFYDLRDYTPGDDIKDIDWKSTAKSSKLLVRRYIAEKKHNILFVLDTGAKMDGDTDAGLPKQEVALMSAGIPAYLAHKNGDVVGAVYHKGDDIRLFNFKSGLANLEIILQNYHNDICTDTPRDLNGLLRYISTHISRKMIMFVVTDLAGLESLKDDVLRRVTVFSDVMFIVINDAYLTGENVFDLNAKNYVPPMLAGSARLGGIERQMRAATYDAFIQKFKKHRITMTAISNTDQVVEKMIDLLERHSHATRT